MIKIKFGISQMALFGSKTKTSLQKTVRPTVVRTQNVAKEIAAIAQLYSLRTDVIDFNILDIQTYTRMFDGTKETDWGEVQSSDLYELDDEKTLLNPNFQIKQTYEIEIFSINKEEDYPFKTFQVAVGANASKCKVYLSVSTGSTLKFKNDLEPELTNLINKKKIRAGILINIFDEMLKDVTSKISAQTRVGELLEYKQNQTILIAEGFEPTTTTNDAIIMHYEENHVADEHTKVDYAARGFIQNVKKDELLIEYIKPKLGTPGRNCRGEYMKPAEPTISNEITFKVSDNILEVQAEDTIQYIAKENGYITFVDNTYDIKTDMEIGEISFRTTGSISSGIDSDVSLNVKETNVEKDAIGTGMNVEVTEIDIDGNVGSNATVVAKRATVSGQTHGTAVVRADKLEINIHKGKAFGKDIKITRLENGEVDGDSVSIKQALGGTVRAKELDIEICASHVTATASKLIEIKFLQGSENVFIIDPLVKRMAQRNLNENKGNISELENDVRDINKEIIKYTALVKEGTPAFMEIRKKLMHYKKIGVKLPASFVQKYKKFTQVQEHLKELQQTYDQKHDQLSMQTTKTASFQDNILDARIINRDHWIGYNEIKFKLVDPPIELVYRPEQGSQEKIFGLVELDDGQFEIQALAQ